MRGGGSEETISVTALNLLAGIFLILLMSEFLPFQCVPLKNPLFSKVMNMKINFGGSKMQLFSLCSLCVKNMSVGISHQYHSAFEIKHFFFFSKSY